MQLADYLKDIQNFPILGLESFSTFLKVCENVSEWALDDIGLANRADMYKIWVCWQKKDSLQDLKKVTERYQTMKLLTHYLDVSIVEGSFVGLYITLDWKQKWIMTYGITNNKKLFKVGEFDFNQSVKLPESSILKYVTEDTDEFDSRKHFLLRMIKLDLTLFDPGYCRREDPCISEMEVVITTKGLGRWNGTEIADGEADRLLQEFKNWVKTQKWWDYVVLVVRPAKSGWIDFVIKLK